MKTNLKTMSRINRLCAVLAFTAVVTVGTASSQAQPSVWNYSADASALHIEWKWNPEAAGTSSINFDPNWSVSLSITRLQDNTGWNVLAQYQHLTDPDPAIGEPGPAGSTIGFGVLFPDSNYGTLSDVTSSSTHGFDQDSEHFVFDRSMLSDNSRIKLDVVHVPEPGTTALLFLGICGLTNRLWRKRVPRTSV